MDERRPRRQLPWVVVLMLLAVLWWRTASTPIAIVVSAVAPAVLYAALVTRLDRRAHEPTGLRMAAFLWGAVVAAATASTVNALLQAWVSAISAGAEASVLVPRLGAPIVEEIAKGTALVILVIVSPRELPDARGGMVYGALIGLGFAASENLLYLTMAALQGGYGGLLRGAYLRATVYGMNHAVFTATSGAAIGYARAVSSRALAIVVPIVGFAGAVALHVLWNTIVSDAVGKMLCAAPVAGAACRNPPPAETLYLTVPLLVMLFIGPCVAALLAVGTRSRAR